MDQLLCRVNFAEIRRWFSCYEERIMVSFIVCVYIFYEVLHCSEIIQFTSFWNKLIQILKFCPCYAITLLPTPFP
jgi:hypothetical protein